METGLRFDPDSAFFDRVSLLVGGEPTTDGSNTLAYVRDSNVLEVARLSPDGDVDVIGAVASPLEGVQILARTFVEQPLNYEAIDSDGELVGANAFDGFLIGITARGVDLFSEDGSENSLTRANGILLEDDDLAAVVLHDGEPYGLRSSPVERTHALIDVRSEKEVVTNPGIPSTFIESVPDMFERDGVLFLGLFPDGSGENQAPTWYEVETIERDGETQVLLDIEGQPILIQP